MFKSKSSFTTRSDAFFFWESDDLVVALKSSNFDGAKGVTKFGLQTLNSSVDTTAAEPRLKGHQ